MIYFIIFNNTSENKWGILILYLMSLLMYMYLYIFNYVYVILFKFEILLRIIKSKMKEKSYREKKNKWDVWEIISFDYYLEGGNTHAF